MTFWHSLASFKAHLAHLPSPVMVTFSSAAKVRTDTSAANNTAIPATNANDFFILRSFPLGLCQHPLTSHWTLPKPWRSKESGDLTPWKSEDSRGPHRSAFSSLPRDRGLV